MHTARSLVVVHPDVVSTSIDGEEVLLHLSSGLYFGLDVIGARIWRDLQAGKEPQAILRSLEEEYAVSPHQLVQDYSRLLADLRTHHLVR